MGQTPLATPQSNEHLMLKRANVEKVSAVYGTVTSALYDQQK